MNLEYAASMVHSKGLYHKQLWFFNCKDCKKPGAVKVMMQWLSVITWHCAVNSKKKISNNENIWQCYESSIIEQKKTAKSTYKDKICNYGNGSGFISFGEKIVYISMKEKSTIQH